LQAVFTTHQARSCNRQKYNFFSPIDPSNPPDGNCGAELIDYYDDLSKPFGLLTVGKKLSAVLFSARQTAVSLPAVATSTSMSSHE
jgi:hypothetical protein